MSTYETPQISYDGGNSSMVTPQCAVVGIAVVVVAGAAVWWGAAVVNVVGAANAAVIADVAAWFVGVGYQC